MILGNYAMQRGFDPAAFTDWFHRSFVDGYDWVMVPNVVGMSQHADGGVLATKPYAAGGGYIDKMTDYCGGCALRPQGAGRGGRLPVHGRLLACSCTDTGSGSARTRGWRRRSAGWTGCRTWMSCWPPTRIEKLALRGSGAGSRSVRSRRRCMLLGVGGHVLRVGGLQRRDPASNQPCASGPSWPESRSAFSPVTVTLLANELPPTAESTAGQPIL